MGSPAPVDVAIVHGVFPWGRAQTTPTGNGKNAVLKANGRIRTDNPWFTKPTPEDAKTLSEQQLAEERRTDSADYLAQILEQYPELAELATIWPSLSVELRDAVRRTAGL